MTNEIKDTEPVVRHEEWANSGETDILSTEPFDSHAAKLVRRKFDRHIVPYLSGLWLFSFLDRSNIGNAAISGLPEDLGLTGTQFNLALLLFYIPYILVDVPSNWMLKFFRPGHYLSATFLGFTKSFGGLVTCRLLLGAFEGGLIPGILVYLSMFYKRSEMAFRLGLFYCAAPLSGAFGGLFAAALAKIEAGRYQGWPWIFFIEGGATVLFGTASFLFLPQSISQAKFLSEQERTIAQIRLESDSQAAENRANAEEETFSWHWVRLAFKSPLTYLIPMAYLFVIIPLYSFSLFTPTIVRALGYTDTTAQLLTAPPNLLGFVAVLIVTRLSDKTGLRGPYIFAGATIIAIGYALQLGSSSSRVKYAGTFFVAFGVFPCSPLILAWLSNNSSPFYVRATTSGFLLAVANLAAFPAAYSYLEEDAPLYILGHSINVGAACLAAILTACTMWYIRWENSQRANGNRNWRLQGVNPYLLGNLHPRFKHSI